MAEFPDQSPAIDPEGEFAREFRQSGVIDVDGLRERAEGRLSGHDMGGRGLSSELLSEMATELAYMRYGWALDDYSPEEYRRIVVEERGRVSAILKQRGEM
jgi:hypothetical protein|tara:strand:+ start:112 stop:414 length:303 start_codon:yes stop_codon:yes gene_type:complete